MSRKDMPELDILDEDMLGDIFDDLDSADLDDFDLDSFDLDSIDLDSADLDDDFLKEDGLKTTVLAEEQTESKQPEKKAVEEKRTEKKSTENKNIENNNTEVEITGAEEDLLSLFNGVDSILNGASEPIEAASTGVPLSPENAAANSALEAFLGAGTSQPSSDNLPMGDIFGGDLSAGSLFGEETNTVPQDDEDVLKILEGLDGIDLELEEDVTGAGGNDAAANSAMEAFMGQQAAGSAEQTTGKKKEKKEKKKADGKGGFWSKLSLILFGEDEEDEEDDKNKKIIIGSDDASGIETIELDIDGADNLSLFGEAPAAQPKEEKGKKEKKEKKKKEKKEKPKKEKKEKPKKEKKPKPKKEKKPKPPKEPDNTPPLPKKPVFLIFLMAASLVALILMGTDLLGYANQMNSAKNQYAKQNYSAAFAEVSGMKIKEEDLALYEKYHVMAMVSTELEAYETLMNAGVNDMALDCLIRTMGRAQKYRADAETYGCIQELNTLENEAEAILSQMFGVSKEQALELYASKTKEEYSYAIKKILKDIQ